ncbi:MAG: AAA family ATPase [Lewinellaceae bacterium]|nr:AAA family ATPase [Lewinellaceae bacterium]
MESGPPGPLDGSTDLIHYPITFPEKGDFLIDGNLLFETGGKNKTGKQTHHWPTDKAFTAAYGIEYGRGNRIPLWLFGFLY